MYIYCPYCGNVIDSGSTYCPYCRNVIQSVQANTQPVYGQQPTQPMYYMQQPAPQQSAPQQSVPSKGKNKTTAGLLAFFLGHLGIHRFYLNNAIGVLYLLFCWTLIPSIISFIEAIVFWTMSDEDFDEKYNG